MNPMSSLAQMSEAIADVVEKVGPSLVRIEAGHAWNATGTVWSEDGLILTTDHVVERDENIEVGLPDGSTGKASVVGRDRGTDLCLLRTDAKGLVPAAFRPLGSLRVGNLAIAAARPGRTVRATLGVVSALAKEPFRTQNGGQIDAYLESDAAMPPGFSGGVLVDLEGKALGLATRGLSRRSPLTVPTATLERVVGELVAHGKVRRGYLGVGVHRVQLQAAHEAAAGQPIGVLVHGVEPGSPADKAGILVGDVLLAVSGERVSSPWELAGVLQAKIEADITVRLLRGGQIIDLPART
jgi:S1-C subfamily serine protease